PAFEVPELQAVNRRENRALHKPMLGVTSAWQGRLQVLRRTTRRLPDRRNHRTLCLVRNEPCVIVKVVVT
ncbi:hypothetical protein ACQKDL_06695, partial [Pseudomonas bubulae]|uniref:hypothetical protein n=1 Tax=Pseudomonas bubulae TaxID=2316085 RepID=UPI003D036376